jgi:hypothetical protein
MRLDLHGRRKNLIEWFFCVRVERAGKYNPHAPTQMLVFIQCCKDFF